MRKKSPRTAGFFHHGDLGDQKTTSAQFINHSASGSTVRSRYPRGIEYKTAYRSLKKNRDAPRCGEDVPGRSEAQKKKLAEAITETLIKTLGADGESISVGIEDVQPGKWMKDVYEPEITEKRSTIYKAPGY